MPIIIPCQHDTFLCQHNPLGYFLAPGVQWNLASFPCRLSVIGRGLHYTLRGACSILHIIITSMGVATQYANSSLQRGMFPRFCEQVGPPGHQSLQQMEPAPGQKITPIAGSLLRPHIISRETGDEARLPYVLQSLVLRALFDLQAKEIFNQWSLIRLFPTCEYGQLKV